MGIVINAEFYEVSNPLSIGLSSGPQFEILHAIVMSYAIFVMDMLKLFKFSSNMFFHYYSMLRNNFTIHFTFHIPIIIHSPSKPFMGIFASIVCLKAIKRTKLSFRSIVFGWRSIFFFFAINTYNILTVWKGCLITFFTAIISNIMSVISVKHILTDFTYSRIANRASFYICPMQSLFNCHRFLLNKIAPTVVQESRSLHGEGEKEKDFGQFLNALIIQNFGGVCHE